MSAARLQAIGGYRRAQLQLHNEWMHQPAAARLQVTPSVLLRTEDRSRRSIERRSAGSAPDGCPPDWVEESRRTSPDSCLDCEPPRGPSRKCYSANPRSHPHTARGCRYRDPWEVYLTGFNPGRWPGCREALPGARAASRRLEGAASPRSQTRRGPGKQPGPPPTWTHARSGPSILAAASLAATAS